MSQDTQQTADGTPLAGRAGSALPVQITPDGKWHLALRSPEGYGFDVQWDTEPEIVVLLESLIECAKEPEGLSAHLAHCVRVLSPNAQGSATTGGDF